MRMILLGPPGSGKGRSGEKIAETYGIPRFSTGDLLREAVSEGKELGRRAQAAMDRGELVSDDIVIGLIEEQIQKLDSERSYILDGFPRNISQAYALEKIDPERKDLALDILIDDDEVVERLSSRRICTDCGAVYNLNEQPPQSPKICDRCGGQLIQRDDDRPEVIKKRLGVYHEQTEKMISYYKDRGVYHKVDGSGDIDTVFKRIQTVLEKAFWTEKES